MKTIVHCLYKLHPSHKNDLVVDFVSDTFRPGCTGILQTNDLRDRVACTPVLMVSPTLRYRIRSPVNFIVLRFEQIF